MAAGAVAAFRLYQSNASRLMMARRVLATWASHRARSYGVASMGFAGVGVIQSAALRARVKSVHRRHDEHQESRQRN